MAVSKKHFAIILVVSIVLLLIVLWIRNQTCYDCNTGYPDSISAKCAYEASIETQHMCDKDDSGDMRTVIVGGKKYCCYGAYPECRANPC